MIQRRAFLAGLAAGIVAPAIVRPASLMPVKAMAECSVIGTYNGVEVYDSIMLPPARLGRALFIKNNSENTVLLLSPFGEETIRVPAGATITEAGLCFLRS